jgi:hypothetical protein
MTDISHYWYRLLSLGLYVCNAILNTTQYVLLTDLFISSWILKSALNRTFNLYSACERLRMSTHEGDFEKQDPKDCNKIRQELPPCFVWYGISLQTIIIFCLFLSPSDIFAPADTVNSIDLYEWTANLQAAKDGIHSVCRWLCSVRMQTGEVGCEVLGCCGESSGSRFLLSWRSWTRPRRQRAYLRFCVGFPGILTRRRREESLYFLP